MAGKGFVSIAEARRLRATGGLPYQSANGAAGITGTREVYPIPGAERIRLQGQQITGAVRPAEVKPAEVNPDGGRRTATQAPSVGVRVIRRGDHRKGTGPFGPLRSPLDDQA